jgi:hypothetical protein
MLGTGKVTLTRQYEVLGIKQQTFLEICLGSEAQILWLFTFNSPRPSMAHMEAFQKKGVHINEDLFRIRTEDLILIIFLKS